MARKDERDQAQLDAFETEYAERLASEKKRDAASQFLDFLGLLARGVDNFYADEIKGRDPETRRLFALRGKIVALRERLGEAPGEGERLLPIEKPFVPDDTPPPKKPRGVRFLADPIPPGHLFPVSFDEIKAVLAELPTEHAQTVREVRLSNQKRTGTDGDWLDGEIRLHCLLGQDGRRAMGRMESSLDVERFGGKLEWEGTKLFAAWPLEAYKTFVLRRVLIHEVAHGVAELPGYADKVRRAGSVEKFCEQYAENFYRPPGKAVKLLF